MKKLNKLAELRKQVVELNKDIASVKKERDDFKVTVDTIKSLVVDESPYIMFSLGRSRNLIEEVAYLVSLRKENKFASDTIRDLKEIIKWQINPASAIPPIEPTKSDCD